MRAICGQTNQCLMSNGYLSFGLVLPLRKVLGKGKPMRDPLDQVILVDENDQEIGTMDKLDAHRGDGQLHRAISVYLFRKAPDGTSPEVLVQRRSATKIVGAGQWGNTVCGNVRPGETYEDCALRRLREELGIEDARIEPIHKFRYQVRCNDEFSENEIDQVFWGYYNGEPAPNPEEVSDYAWAKWNNLLEASTTGYVDDLEIVPWLKIMLNDKVLIKRLNEVLQQAPA